jgi:tetratricopeptide (TPR) repeat protein
VASMHYWRAQAYYKLEKYNEALLDYTRSIELNKNDGYSYGARGHCFYMLGKYKEARIDYNKVIELMPENAHEYWYWRGTCNYNLDLKQESFNDFALFLKKNPHDAYALLMSGHCQYVMEDFTLAIAYYTKAINEKSDYSEAYYWRANSHFKLNELGQSLKDLNQAIQLDPTNETYKTFKKENFK